MIQGSWARREIPPRKEKLLALFWLFCTIQNTWRPSKAENGRPEFPQAWAKRLAGSRQGVRNGTTQNKQNHPLESLKRLNPLPVHSQHLPRGPEAAAARRWWDNPSATPGSSLLNRIRDQQIIRRRGHPNKTSRQDPLFLWFERETKRKTTSLCGLRGPRKTQETSSKQLKTFHTNTTEKVSTKPTEQQCASEHQT